jgi:carbonic anhydrase/acetyltransferase-like protein (isoleucine patch superfamily)
MGPGHVAAPSLATDTLWGSDAVPIYALDYAAPVIDPQAFVHPDAVVIGAVELAAGASVWPGAVLRGDHGLIKVGERTSVQDGTIVHTTEECPTVIGADCVVGHRAHLEGCVVEDGCLIGSGSLVLNRARVAAGAVVAAAALVLEDMTVPAGSLAIGVPATIRPDAGLRQRSWIKHAVQDYLDLAERHRTGLRRLDRPSVIAAGPGTPELSAPGGMPELSARPGLPELSAYPVASRSACSVSGEGAFEGDPAAGVGEIEGGVGVAGDGPAEGVDEVVVVHEAEQGQFVEAGGAALAPGADVVGGGPGG